MDKLKAVFVDLDNTLWNGILAEKQQLTLNVHFYDFLKQLYQKGVILFIVSKNELSDVKKAFQKLNIDENLFVYLAVNWDAKYLNLEKIIEVTAIRPETAVFIDDNSFEREEVKIKIPKLTILKETEYGKLNSFLDSMKMESDTEITNRINRFKTAIDAGSERSNYKEDESFLRSLNRKISIGKISPDKLERFTKLLVSTHRINFNPGTFPKYDEALDYLHQRMNEGYELYAVSAEENNVSLGLVGALVVKIEGDEALLTDGTFSCSIIGRDIESKSLLGLIEILKEKGLSKMRTIVTFTETNSRIRELLDIFGFKEEKTFPKTEESDLKALYVLDLKHFSPKDTFDWIKITGKAPQTDYVGLPSVIDFFNHNVLPIIKKDAVISNLGSAKGEVFGWTEPSKKQHWDKFIKEKNVTENKVDIEYYPEEKNIVGNAEDLKGIIKDNSQDLVMAVELLEHTEHFWKCINEIIRITKVGGYIFITVPSFGYPKHEYPIDQWRIGSKTLKSFFMNGSFTIVNFETEGQADKPRRCMILIRKEKEFTKQYDLPSTGEINWTTGLTVFP